MATARTICSDALRDTSDAGIGEGIDADEATYVLRIFNDMMFAMRSTGCNLVWTELALEDTVPLEPEYLGGVKAMLTEAIMARAGDQIPVELKKEAGMGKRALKAGYRLIPKMKFDKGVRRMPSQRHLTSSSST